MSRDELSTLLWPGRDHRLARSNLRKLLLDLRAMALPDLQEGPAGLRWLIDNDVQGLRQAWQAGQWQRVAESGASPLMQGLEGRLDAPGHDAFSDWLQAERLHWQRRWREAAHQALPQLGASSALALVQQLLAFDPQDELALRAAEQARLALVGTAEPAQRHFTPPVASPQAAGGRQATRPEPADLSPLVGRERELQQLRRVMAEQRLVTVLGPGGVGKSRLVRHAVTALGRATPAQAVQSVLSLVLEDAATPGAVPARLAAALRLALPPQADAARAVEHWLAPRSMLLVLDGFEGVIDAGHWLLQLLNRAPELRVLVTSRERLGVDGEWLLPLGGLELPAPGLTEEVALQTEAVQLFNRRALAVLPGFDARAALPHVAEICRRVDGLPLALELAAAWVRLLPPADIVRELGPSLQLLREGGAQTGLEVVFERSWQLLTHNERGALTRLAVFSGGFTRQRALRVCGVGLPLLAALLDKSMLRSLPAGRLGMHPVVAAFAQDRLAILPGRDTLAEAHSRCHLQALSANELDASLERGNLLTAWHQAVARGDAAAVEAVLFSLPWSTLVHGRLNEALPRLEAAAVALGREVPAGAQLLALQAWMLLWLERRTEAVDLARRALQVLQPAGHVSGSVMALRTLGHAALRNGQHDSAAEHLAQALNLARQAGRAPLQAAMLDAWAMAQTALGHFDPAREALHAARELNRESGDAIQRIYNDHNLARVCALSGDVAAALPWAEASLAKAERSGHDFFVPIGHADLARVLCALGQMEAARHHAAQALRLGRDNQDPQAQAAAHEAQACIALATGDRAGAQQALAVAVVLCVAGCNVPTGAALVPLAAQACGPSTRSLAWLHSFLGMAEVPAGVRAQAKGVLADFGAGVDTGAGAAQALPRWNGLMPLLEDVTDALRTVHACQADVVVRLRLAGD